MSFFNFSFNLKKKEKEITLNYNKNVKYTLKKELKFKKILNKIF
jgi:hypothetical protein